MTPRQSQYKRVLDDVVLRLTLWWITSGWRPVWSITRREKVRRSNAEAVSRLRQEL